MTEIFPISGKFVHSPQWVYSLISKRHSQLPVILFKRLAGSPSTHCFLFPSPAFFWKLPEHLCFCCVSQPWNSHARIFLWRNSKQNLELLFHNVNWLRRGQHLLTVKAQGHYIVWSKVFQIDLKVCKHSLLFSVVHSKSQRFCMIQRSSFNHH